MKCRVNGERERYTIHTHNVQRDRYIYNTYIDVHLERERDSSLERDKQKLVFLLPTYMIKFDNLKLQSLLNSDSFLLVL